MSKILLLEVGPPGSGKSGHAYMMMEKFGFVRSSQDDQGKKGHMEVFNLAIANGENIVVDRMGFSLNQRNRYLDPARKAGYEIRIVVHHVPKAVCLERMLVRKEHPTIKDEKSAQSALKTFFGKYKRVEDSEADIVIRLGHDNFDRPLAIYSDLDGTLCAIEHRRHFLNKDKEAGIKPRWKDFFDGMIDDGVHEWCRDILERFSVDHSIVFATGRPDSYEKMTKSWFYANKIVAYSDMFMRPRYDCRRDDIVKEIILEFEIKPRYNVVFAIDDRQQVVDMLRKHGLTVLQCAPGNF